MQNVLLVVQLIVAVALVAVVLVQRTAADGGGLAGGGSTMGGLFTARGSANILTRATAVLATIFILNSLALGVMASRRGDSGSLVDQFAPVSAAPVGEETSKSKTQEQEPETPAAPEVPLAQ